MAKISLRASLVLLAVLAAVSLAGCGGGSSAASSAPVQPGGNASSGAVADASLPVTPGEKKSAACVFARKWLDDWSFEGGEMQKNAKELPDRVLPLVAVGSTLYRELNDESNFVGPKGKYFHGAAFCVVDVSATAIADDTYRATVSVYGTQNTITKEGYARMTRDPSKLHRFRLVVTVDDNGKITDLVEEGFVS